MRYTTKQSMESKASSQR